MSKAKVKRGGFVPDLPTGGRPIDNKNTRPDESNHQAKYWIFTLPNPTQMEEARLKVYAETHCIYLGYGHEESPKTGTPHLQGYIQLKKVTKGQTVKNQSKCLRLWMGIANGSAEKNINYCFKEYDEELWDEAKKDGYIFEYGEAEDTKKGQRKGGRTQGGKNAAVWKELNQDINHGATENEIRNKYGGLYYRHHSGITRGITVANKVPIRTSKTCVHVLMGPPGVGKTKLAMSEIGINGYSYSSPNKIWWSGYDGTSSVLMDDFHGNYPFDEWKKLTDQYAHRVPVHNGLINFNPDRLYITTNANPNSWWKDEVFGTHGRAAMWRRINVYEVWDPSTKKFIPGDTAQEMWADGCVCDPKFAKPSLEENSQEDPYHAPTQETAADLQEMEFSMEDMDWKNVSPAPVTSAPLKIKESREPLKKRKFPPIPTPSKKISLKRSPKPQPPMKNFLERQPAVIVGSESDDESNQSSDLDPFEEQSQMDDISDSLE